MPSWNDPSNTNPVHTNVLEDLGKKDTYALTMGQEDPGYTDLPTGTMTWDNNQKILRRREGGTPLPAVLSLAGGGTGATDAAGARTVLQVNKSGTADGEARTNAQNDLRYLKLTTDFSGLTDKPTCFNNIKQAATSSVTGVVKLNNTLTSTATDAALTAAQGKVLRDQATLRNTTFSQLRFSFKADWNGSSYTATDLTGDQSHWGIQSFSTSKIGTGIFRVTIFSGVGDYTVQATALNSSFGVNVTVGNITSTTFQIYCRRTDTNALVDCDTFITLTKTAILG